MTTNMHEDGSGTTENAPRDCGGCNVCCTAMHVRPLNKPAGERCPQQTEAGCGMYETRPSACREWYCMWVRDPGKLFADEHRPDKLGVFFTASMNTGKPKLFAHPIRDGATEERAVIERLGFLRQFAEVEVLPTRDVATAPVATLTIEGKEVA